MSDHDARIVGMTIYGEARGEISEGKRAVGHVIHNRWRAGRYGRTHADVCQAPYQFECWNDGNCNRNKMDNADDSYTQMAKRIIKGRDGSDPTGGATHYHVNTPQVKADHPWSKHGQVTTVIGNHVFYKNVD